eukprot:3408137-Rhodomonas_salina.2
MDLGLLGMQGTWRVKGGHELAQRSLFRVPLARPPHRDVMHHVPGTDGASRSAWEELPGTRYQTALSFSMAPRTFAAHICARRPAPVEHAPPHL